MHTLTRSRTRILFIYMLYIYSFPARMRSPPRSPAPLRTRFYLFPFLYDLLSSISPLFKIYSPFFSSLYDLFSMLYVYIPFFYDLYIKLYVLYSTDELHMSNCSYVRRLTMRKAPTDSTPKRPKTARTAGAGRTGKGALLCRIISYNVYQWHSPKASDRLGRCPAVAGGGAVFNS